MTTEAPVATSASPHMRSAWLARARDAQRPNDADAAKGLRLQDLLGIALGDRRRLRGGDRLLRRLAACAQLLSQLRGPALDNAHRRGHLVGDRRLRLFHLRRLLPRHKLPSGRIQATRG